MKHFFFGALLLAGLAGIVSAQQPANGLTLIAPRMSTESFLIDLDGNIVQTWHGTCGVRETAYLLPDGSLLRPCEDPNGEFVGGGAGGLIQKIDANDNIVWSYLFSNHEHQQHHDIQPMPNGNVLLVSWERLTEEEARAAGRQQFAVDELWPTLIVEVEPDGASGGNVVWEWRIWDHLIQDADPTKANYGVVEDHPELFDANLRKVKNENWDVINAIDYNPELDQILLSVKGLDEFAIIDHSTTTEEAAGHTGGRYGRGGDILYRWGNPFNYRRGTKNDRYYYNLHGANWIDPGLPGAGHILTFNNNNPGDDGEKYSSVEEIAPPIDANGNYILEPGTAYGPEAPVWRFDGPPTFHSKGRGGAYRMPNGNTLISEGDSANVFEVTTSGEVVWQYTAPGAVHRAERYFITQVVGLDVLPGSCVNPFNVTWMKNVEKGSGKTNKGGVLPLAIAGSADFDVADVSVSTLRLDGVAPLRSSVEDVTAPAEGEGECPCTDRGADGYPDLLLKFDRRELAEAIGTRTDGEIVTLRLHGSLHDGTLFEGHDCVRITNGEDKPSKPDGPQRADARAGMVALYPAVPNPFNPVTRIRYDLASAGFVRLTVFDVAGRVVERLVSENQSAGEHTIEWNAHGAPSGIYFYRLEVGAFSETHKLVLLK